MQTASEGLWTKYRRNIWLTAAAMCALICFVRSMLSPSMVMGRQSQESAQKNRNDGIDVYSDLGCDPSGTADCTSALASAIAAHPGASFIFGVPQSRSSATYLLAGNANLTIPQGVSIQFQNGAQIMTGNRGSAAISSISRTTANTGSYSINLTGCTSSANGTTETFSHCPNNLQAFRQVILSGLTNVANCYPGCEISDTTGTGFAVFNPDSKTVRSASETGNAIQNSANQVMLLKTLGGTSSISDGIVTIDVTNSLPAVPTVVKLAGTTNVPAGSYVLIPSSVTQRRFQLVCPRCSDKSPAPETGTVTYVSGGLTFVHFSSPLPGVPAAGWMSPQSGNSAGLAQVVCTGTANYNGPYWITAVADSQDIALLDPRATARTETSGSCYFPYTLTVNGTLAAPQGAQVVAHNSAVILQGQNPIYVGWYGAKGYTASSDDSQSFQEALFWNAGKHVVAPHIAAASYGAAAKGKRDYTIAQTLQLYGNAQWLDGDVGALWQGGTALDCTMTTGPCIIDRPDTMSTNVSNLSLVGQNCANGMDAVIEVPANFIANDGYLVLGGEPRGSHLSEECFARDGVHISSLGNLNVNIDGAGQPDYWMFDNFLGNANYGYGFSCWGQDCNGGHLVGTSDSRSSIYGGYYDMGQVASLFDGGNGEGNSPSFAAGPQSKLLRLTVSGFGYNAQCTATFTRLPLGFSVNRWITVAGSNSSGGAANTDGTFRITATTSTSETHTCPGASGGPSMAGTEQTANSDSVYTVIQEYPDGEFRGRWVIAGLIGGSYLTNGPYSESTNGCITGNGLIVGGDLGEYLYQGNCISQGYAQSHLFDGAYIGGGSGVLSMFANGILVRGLGNGGTNTAEEEFNAPWNGSKTKFKGTMGFAFSSDKNQNYIDWHMGEVSGGGFELRDAIDYQAGKPFPLPFAVVPATDTQINAPAPTASVDIQDQWTGPVNFYSHSSPTTQITRSGISSAGISGAAGVHFTPQPGAIASCSAGHLCDDFSGQISYESGGSPIIGTLLTIGFTHTRTNAPNCVIEVDGRSGMVITNTESTTVNSLIITANSAMSPSTRYSISYVCGGQ